MRVRFLVLGLAVGVWLWSALGAAPRVRADELTGRWSGEVEGRGNYYYERSTRVMIPTGRVAIASPNGIRMHVDYLVDIITSASIPSGASEDKLFTELRHGIGAGVGKRFDAGENDLDLSVFGIYSTEDDYKSYIYGAAGAYSFNEKNTSLSLSLTGVNDKIYQKQTFRGNLDGITASLGFSQILSPTLTLGLAYQLAHLGGFLGNAYRSAPTTGVPLPEKPPRLRLRHNLAGQLSWYVPYTRSTLQLYLRLYTDSWSVQAITPELHLYQGLGRDFMVRLSYRLYAQTAAYFSRMIYPANYTGYATGDPKLTEFSSHQFGIRLTFTLNALASTILDWASKSMLDVSFNYQTNTNSFGDNITGTLGGRVVF